MSHASTLNLTLIHLTNTLQQQPVHRKHAMAHNGTTPLCVVTVVVPLYTG